MVTRLKLVIEAGYGGDASDEDFVHLLHEITANAFANGQFTGDLDASVVYVESRVLILAEGDEWLSIGVPTLMVSEDENE